MTGLVLTPGIHDDLPANVYHADALSDRPTLSAGGVKQLLNHSPLHAWSEHPRLNPDFEHEDEPKFDLGTAVHALLLQGEQVVGVVEGFDDWRKQAARDARDEIRRDNHIPMLAKDWERCERMIDAVREQLDARPEDPPLFTAGKPEQTIIFERHGVLCRARVDWLHDSFMAVDDFKSAGGSANPKDWARRTFWSIGCDIQIAFHSLAVETITGVHPEWRYVVAETQPPYALAVVTVGASVLELGQRKVDWAIGKWRECLESDLWPGYDSHVVEVDTWQDADFISRTWTPDEEGVAA